MAQHPLHMARERTLPIPSPSSGLPGPQVHPVPVGELCVRARVSYGDIAVVREGQEIRIDVVGVSVGDYRISWNWPMSGAPELDTAGELTGSVRRDGGLPADGA